VHVPVVRRRGDEPNQFDNYENLVDNVDIRKERNVLVNGRIPNSSALSVNLNNDSSYKDS
jgi:hypothetical protein